MRSTPISTLIGRWRRHRRTAVCRLDRDRGAALPMVLVMIVIGAMIVVPVMTYTSAVLRANKVEQDRAIRVEAAKGAIRTALDDPGLLFTGCPANASDLLTHGVVDGVSIGIACDPLDELSAEEVFGLQVPIGAAQLQVGPGPAGFAPWTDGTIGQSIDYESAVGATVPPYEPDANTWWTDFEWTGVAADPTVPVSPQEIWVPSLPTYSNTVRGVNPFPMPSAFDCEVYLPGYYPNGLTIDSPGNYYFASGVYYFEGVVTIRGGADVVVGQGLADFGIGNDCADDIQVGANVSVPIGTVYAIDGNTGGATWVFGNQGRLVIDDTGGSPDVQFNQRYADPDRGGWINIMSVNGDWSYDNGDHDDDDEFEDSVGDHSATNVNWVARSTVRSGDNTLTLDEASGSYVPSHPSLTDEARRPTAPGVVTGVALTREVPGPDDGAIVVSFSGVEGSATNGAIIDDYEVGIATSAVADPVATCSVSGNTIWPTTERPAGADPWGRAQAAIGENAANPDGYGCLITRLPENSSYWVTARANNEAGWSDWAARTVVPVPVGAPAAGNPAIFGGITFEGYGTDGALVSWDPSLDPAQAPVQGYEVTVYRVTDVEFLSIVPDLGVETGGVPVVITGTGLSTATSVTFDGLPATAFVVVDDSTITAVTPAHAAGVVDVVVRFDDEASAPLPFTYTAVPAPVGPSTTSLAPANGPEAGGTTVMLDGSGYTDATAVSFGGLPGTGLVVVDDTRITVNAPPGTGTVPVTVTTPLGVSSPLAYTYDPPPSAPPVASTITPASGPPTGGTTVTITGSGFLDASTVTFGGTAGTNLTIASDTSLTVDTPAHPTGNAVVDVAVVSSAGASVPLDFSYGAPAAPPPSISTIAPASGSTTGGTIVTLTGANFTGATAVNFGGTPGTSLQVVSDTQIRVTAPPRGAGATSAVVVGPTATSNAVTYTYSANSATPWPVSCRTVMDEDDCDDMPSCPAGEVAVLEYTFWGNADWSCENACYNGDVPVQRFYGWTCAPGCPSGQQPDFSYFTGWHCDPISCNGGRVGVYAYGRAFCYRPASGFAGPPVRYESSELMKRLLAPAPAAVPVSEVVSTCTAQPRLGRGADADLEWMPVAQCTIDSLPPLGTASAYRVEVRAISATGVTAVSANFGGPSGTGTVDEAPGRIWYPYVPSPIVSLTANDGSTKVSVPGYVSVPMGRFRVSNPAGAAIELNGGVVAGTFSVSDPRTPAPFGFEPTVVMQRTIRLVTTVDNVQSTAVVKINSDTNYGISRWVTQ